MLSNSKHIAGLLLAALTCASAAAASESLSDTVSVRFRQSKSDLNLSYEGNGARLDSLLRKIREREAADSLLTVKNVTVIGGASPEGSVALNRTLSLHRADAIYRWIASRTDVLDSVVDFRYLGRDWGGLREMVKEDARVPDRHAVLPLLNSIIAGAADGAYAKVDPLNRLKSLEGGIPYHYMYSHLFPQLRASTVIINYGDRPAPVPSVDFPPLAPAGLLTSAPEPQGKVPVYTLYKAEERHCRPFYMALKTNMLLDALLLPNIGAEFYVGKNWSVGANWMYGWWNNDRTHHYWRAYGGDLTVRRWFGRKADAKPLTGHHLGIYGGVVTYDFELGGTGYMGGVPGGTLWDRCNYFGGVEYGYSLPVARRLNIDFSLGIGFMGGKYIKYQPKNGYYQWTSTNHLKYFGPTKAEVSLVWLIGCDNYNRGKGGAR